MVEFAIILSLLFMLVFGIIQFGIAFNRDQGLKAAAREGARIASVGGTEAEVKTRVRQAQSLFNSNDIKIKIEYPAQSGGGFTWPPDGGGVICDDVTSSPHKCNTNVGPAPCLTAGVANLVRVRATVPGADGKYAIIIPLWGNAHITFGAAGVFRCESS